jgi:VCBS repeat-containing protein
LERAILSNPSQFSGSETVIDFEGLTNNHGFPGDVLDPNQYSAQGVQISLVGPHQAGLTDYYSDASQPRQFGPSGDYVLDDFPLIGTGSDLGTPYPDLDMKFATPMNRVGFELLSQPGVTTVTLLSGGNVVATQTFNTNLNFQFIGLEDLAGFDEVVVHTASTNDAFVIDNLRFESAYRVTVNNVAPTASAEVVNAPIQYASSVINFSSQWTSTTYSAAQATGAPNTFNYGDNSTAWSPLTPNNAEFLTLGFATPIQATGVTVRESWNNGFVSQIDLIDTNDVSHTVFAGTDPSLPGSVVDFTTLFSQTPYLVKAVKVYEDGTLNSSWEEIDSVALIGPTSVSGPSATVNEGDYVSLQGGFTDPGTLDTHTYLWHLVNATNGQTISDVTTQDTSFVPRDDGTYTFHLTVTDDDGGSDTQTVLVTAINAPPAAIADTGATDEDTLLTVSGPGVLSNDTDPAGSYDTLTVTGYSATSTLGATVVVNTDGSYSYDPTTSTILQTLAVGATATDTFSYTVSDGEGGSDTGTVTITVSGVNDAPVANDDNYTTAEDTALSVPGPGVLTNDNDIDGDSFFARSYSGASHGTITLVTDGSFLYTPNANYYGPDSFTYNIEDSHGLDSLTFATVNITVMPVNDPATLSADVRNLTETNIASNLNSSGTLTIIDIDSPATFQPQAGTIGLYGTFAIDIAGHWTYTANSAHDEFSEGTTYTDVFNVFSADGTMTTVTINILGTNDEPVANADIASVTDGSSVNGNVLTNDTDVDDPALNVSSVDLGVNLVGQPIAGKYGTLTLNSDGSYNYVPSGAAPTGSTVTDTFTYTVTDHHGGSEVLFIDFNSYSLGPIADGYNGWSLGNPAFNQHVVTTGGGQGWQFTRQTTSGSFSDQPLSPSLTQTASEPGGGAVTSDFEASWTITPQQLQLGVAGDGFLGIDMDDGSGARGNLLRLENDGSGNWILHAFDYDDTIHAFVDINLGALPVGIPTKVGFTQQFVNGPNNDIWKVYVNDQLVYTGIGWEEYFRDSQPGIAPVTYDRLLFRASGTNVVGDQGVIIDNVSYTTNEQSTLTVSVTGTDDAPVAVDDTFSTNENVPLTLTQTDLKGNDTDVDNMNAQLSVTAVSGAVNGLVVLNGDGTVTFIPAADLYGTAGFDYTISDGSLTDSGHVTINVAQVATTLAFDFEAAGGTTASGQTEVTQSTIYSTSGPNAGYGWVSGSTPTGTYDRTTLTSVSPVASAAAGASLTAVLRDANIGTQASSGIFQADLVPNTSYAVTWLFGDTVACDNMQIAVIGGGNIIAGNPVPSDGNTIKNQSSAGVITNVTSAGVSQTLDAGTWQAVHFNVLTDATGHLQLQFSDAGGANNGWVVNGLSFVPNPSPFPINIPAITRSADASKTDFFTVAVGDYVPGAVYDVVTTLGSGSTDADSRLYSSQVQAPVSGTWSVPVRRPYLTTTQSGTISLVEVEGQSIGIGNVTYTADTTTRKFDFNSTVSPQTATGETPVYGTTVYAAANGYGWQPTGLTGANVVNETSNSVDGSYPAGPGTQLVRDFASGISGASNTFSLNVPLPASGSYTYTIVIYSYDRFASASSTMSVTAEGNVGLTTGSYTVPAQTYVTKSFTVNSSQISADGILDLTFSSTVGNFIVNGIDVVITQMSASGTTGSAKIAKTTTASQLQAIADAAIARFGNAGASATELDLLRSVQFQIQDLGGPGYLGILNGATTVLIDDNGAGNGWYIDTTPADNKGFKIKNGLLIASGKAGKEMDLLSVVMHEFTNVLKYNGQTVPTGMKDAENINLSLGQRWNAPSTPTNLDAAFTGRELADQLRGHHQTHVQHHPKVRKH